MSALSVKETFTDVDWYGRDLSGETYRGCVFREVDLTETTSQGAKERVLRVRELPPERIDALELGVRRVRVPTDVAVQRHPGRMQADRQHLRGRVLRPMTVRGGQWRGVVMRGAQLAQLDLTGLALQDADLSEADLSKVSMRGCDLTGASLRNATLHEADLRGANLAGVDLSTARVGGTRLDMVGALLLAEAHGAVVDVSPDD